MKERPILFSTPMVRALLDGSKTQTRRTAKLTDAAHVKEPRGHRRWHPGDVLNHKSITSTKIYAHLATSHMVDAIGKVGKKSQPKPQAKVA